MAFSSNSSGGGPMADINVTPLVDVMLVLLIIFIITAPLMSHKVKIELPEANLVQEKDKDWPTAKFSGAASAEGGGVGVVGVSAESEPPPQPARISVATPKASAALEGRRSCRDRSGEGRKKALSVMHALS